MEQKIFVFFISALAIVSLAIFIFIMLDKEENNLDNLRTREVCFQGNCFIAELAETSEQRIRGLMFRESMDANKGMLFVFEKEGEHFFWMKNTLIALDIIWINKDKRVVHIEKDVQPCITGPHTFTKDVGAGEECVKIKSNEPAQYVLELIVGSAEKINLKIGDELYFSID